MQLGSSKMHFLIKLSHLKVQDIEESKGNCHGLQANPQWIGSGGKNWLEGERHGRIGSDLQAATLEEAGNIPLSCGKAEGH